MSAPASGPATTAFPDLVPVALRYGDLGPDGLVSTPALARWFEDARISGITGPYSRLVEDGGFEGLRILLATLEVERLAPIRRDADVRVGIGVRRIGRTSFTYGYGVFVPGGCVGRGETVTVLADASGPTPLPEHLYADLERTRLDEPEPEAAPRPPAWRHERAAYPFAVPVPARLGDLDTNRHVNNVTLLSWYAEAVSAFATAAGDPAPERAPWRYRVRYVAEVVHPATYEVTLAVTDHDAGSVTYELGLFREGRCVGLADATGTRGDVAHETLADHAPTP